MKTYLSRRIPVVVAAGLALAMLALGFLAALGVRSLVAGTASASPDAPNPGHEWSQVEGHGVDPDGRWLGTTTDQPLELRVNNERALRLEPEPTPNTGPNVVGGYSGNSATDGVGAATIAGGGSADDGYGNYAPNRVTDGGGTVGGGVNNQAGNNDATLDNALVATVGGGYTNTASGNSSTIGGGYTNTASGGASTIGGGSYNSATADAATIAGGGSTDPGTGNRATDVGATVGGGYDNQAGNNSGTTEDAWFATVGGGSENAASAQNATIAGGYQNLASGTIATVAGGTANTASANNAAVGGGFTNTASGVGATVPGGAYNTAQGDVSLAAGRRAKANNPGCFVWGDFSIDADVACNYNNRFIARASGGVYLYTAGNLSTGAYLASGSGSWSDVSSRDVKDNFTTVDGQEVLASLAEVPMTTWNYKAQDASIRHMGPMAQDFHAAFGLGESDTSITTVDADGVALAAIQGLYQRSQEQGARIQALETQNASLQQRLDDLEARVSALEAGSGAGSAVSQASASGLPTPWLLLGGGLTLALGGLVLVQRRLVGGRR